MQPSPGRIVHYTLTAGDAASIETGRRHYGGRVGNHVTEGDVLPAMIVRVWSNNPESACNLQVHCDGTDTLWATSRKEGEGPGTWAWPPRV